MKAEFDGSGSSRRKILGAAAFTAAAVAGAWIASRSLAADKKSTKTPPSEPEERWSLTSKTLGGLQFWGDCHFFHDWRIQQNVFDKHFRLLDGNDVRHAYGTKDECLKKLTEVRANKKLPPMKKKAVVFIHGILRSAKVFQKMGREFAAEGYETIAFNYPSTRVPIQNSAAYLRDVIDSLEGVEEINLVVHSMGGLVARTYLQNHPCDARIRRLVMIGVPNQGANMANIFKDNFVFQVVFGPAGQQLVEGDGNFVGTLPIPDFEFAIVAGGRGNSKGYNPVIPGDDDGTVAVESTRLPGAQDFITLPVRHSALVADPQVISAARSFVMTGALRKSGAREPIPRQQPGEQKMMMSQLTPQSPAAPTQGAGS